MLDHVNGELNCEIGRYPTLRRAKIAAQRHNCPRALGDRLTFTKHGSIYQADDDDFTFIIRALPKL